jgi:hypothetical protein
MPRVAVTPHLSRFFPKLAERDYYPVRAETVAEVIAKLETEFKGVSAYIVDDRRALRQHVNIFVDGIPVKDRAQLSDALTEDSVVLIFQALSGG